MKEEEGNYDREISGYDKIRNRREKVHKSTKWHWKKRERKN